MTSWVNSPPHYACLIDPKWRTMGAAFVPNPSNPDAHLCGALFGEIVEDPLDAVTMELEALKNLNPPSGVHETEIGVQLPMRLIAIKDGQTGETEIEVYNYEKAPGFTGSGDNVTFKHTDDVDPQPPNDAVFYLDERTLVERLTDGNAGNEPEPGLYALWWRIYHGSGDMIYRLSCAGSQAGESYRDRRNAGIGGGFGTFLTSDVLAANVRLDPEPYPFVCLVGSNRYNVSADGDYRALPAETLTGERSWIGPGGEIVTWSGTPGVPISIGGRNIRRQRIVATEHGRALETDPYPSLFTCLAACLWRDADGLLWLRAAMAIYSVGTITGVRLREFALQVNRQWVTRNTVNAPVIEHTPTLKGRPAATSYSWSQDGTRLCCWAEPAFVDATESTPAMMYPGAAWETTVIIDIDGEPVPPELDVFAEVYRDPLMEEPVSVSTGSGFYTYTRLLIDPPPSSASATVAGTAAARALVSAHYDANTPCVRWLEIAYTRSGSTSHDMAFASSQIDESQDIWRLTTSSVISQETRAILAATLFQQAVGADPVTLDSAVIYNATDNRSSSGTAETVIDRPNATPSDLATYPAVPFSSRQIQITQRRWHTASRTRGWIDAGTYTETRTYSTASSFSVVSDDTRTLAYHMDADEAAWSAALSDDAAAGLARAVAVFPSFYDPVDEPWQHSQALTHLQAGTVSAVAYLLDSDEFNLVAQQSPDGAILAQFQVGTALSVRACTGTLAPEIANVHLDAIHLLGKGGCMVPIPRETP